MLLEHCCAMKNQRHVRGLLTSLYVFEQVYMITTVQACVRRKQAMDTAMNRLVTVIHIQSIFRGAMVRTRQARTVAAATKVQTAWRCFSGRFNYQLDLLNIIIVESVWRRRIAQNVHRGLVLVKARKVSRHDPECAVVVRLHDELLALLADVLITLSIARRWSAKRRCVVLRKSHALTI
jgi:hypothetical protein